MVALKEQFHHNGKPPRLQGAGAGRVFRSWELGVRRLWKRCAAKCEMPDAGYGLQRGGEFVEVFSDHGPMTTDQKFGSSDGLFIDPCSLIFERSAGANDIIYCGYPDNKRVSTDIGTGLNDPEAELYYVRNRSYNPIPGTVLRQEPKSRQATGVATRVLQRDPIGYAGGVNLYEYVGGRAAVAVDPSGMLTEADCDSELNNCVSDCWNRPPPWPFRRNKGYYIECEKGCNKAYLECLKSLEPADCPWPGPAIDIAEGAGAAAEDLTVGDVVIDVIIGIALF